MSDDLFADIEQEGEANEKAFEDLLKPKTEEETPAESQPEKKQEEDEPEEGAEGDAKPEETPDLPAHDAQAGEKPVPFHEHPRWKQREAEMEELRRELEMANRAVEELKTNTPERDTDIPGWFRELYGENTEAWRKYREHEVRTREEIKADILREQQERQELTNRETQKWESWVESEVARLKADGKQFDKNKLMKVMLDYRPTDSNGGFDFDKGYDIYEMLEKKDPVDAEKSKARKKVGADATESSPKGDGKQKEYLTSNDLKNKSWHDL